MGDKNTKEKSWQDNPGSFNSGQNNHEACWSDNHGC
jgi:hypothetical protein